LAHILDFTPRQAIHPSAPEIGARVASRQKMVGTVLFCALTDRIHYLLNEITF